MLPREEVFCGFNKDLMQRLSVSEFGLAVVCDRIAGQRGKFKTNLAILSDYLNVSDSQRNLAIIRECLRSLCEKEVIEMDIDIEGISNKNTIMCINILEMAVAPFLIMYDSEIETIIETLNVLTLVDLKVFAAIVGRVNTLTNQWQITYEQILEDIGEEINVKTIMRSTDRLEDLRLINKHDLGFDEEREKRRPILYELCRSRGR